MIVEENFVIINSNKILHQSITFHFFIYSMLYVHCFVFLFYVNFLNGRNSPRTVYKTYLLIFFLCVNLIDFYPQNILLTTVK